MDPCYVVFPAHWSYLLLTHLLAGRTGTGPSVLKRADAGTVHSSSALLFGLKVGGGNDPSGNLPPGGQLLLAHWGKEPSNICQVTVVTSHWQRRDNLNRYCVGSAFSPCRSPFLLLCRLFLLLHYGVKGIVCSPCPLRHVAL